ncbi:hypothetical protein SRRS_40950 [Sporomusa rhizae]|uniref:rod-binding protein n=1 Tax=Sporomusa rhizae TaxID=357999 RepID=UPI00352A81D2
MRINSNNLIQTNTVAANGDAVLPDQGADFAAKLEKAVAASTKAGKGKESAADAIAKRKEDAKLKTACKDMEAVFLNMMLTQMRATVPKGNLIGESSGEKIMQSLLDTELTKNMSQAGGIGLADMLYRQLSKSTVKGQAVR